jgi:oligopeptide transport system substrate-binding protein
MKFLFLVAGFLLLVGQFGRANGGERNFSLRLLDEPETLDWNRAHTQVETYLLCNLMEGLVSIDAELKIQPALAESWEIQAGGLRYTFHLRPGSKWSDGVPLKAQDFITSWRRLLTPSTGSVYAYLLQDIRGAREFVRGSARDFSRVGVKALDDATLEIELEQPVAYWLNLLSYSHAGGPATKGSGPVVESRKISHDWAVYSGVARTRK